MARRDDEERIGTSDSEAVAAARGEQDFDCTGSCTPELEDWLCAKKNCPQCGL